MISEKYRGLLIEARANELQYDIGWSPILIIEKHDGNGVSATEIPIRGIYPTRAAAMNAALGQGRKEIDGALGAEGSKSTLCISRKDVAP
jgi:hypothetical protein